MQVPYTKPFLGIQEQIALLKSRGMVISDEAATADYLSKIGYYRLSGYWYPFRESEVSGNPGTVVVKDTFRKGTEFDHALKLYVFDKHLRLHFLDALERIEVGLRVEIALLLGQRDPLAHRQPKYLHGHFAKKIDPSTGTTKHAKWLERLDDITNRSSEEFVKQYKRKYRTPLPMWIAIELWDFGLLSHFLSGMTVADKAALASKYQLPRWQLLQSWVRNLNQLRNVCAHHSRLWNRVFTEIPAKAKPGEVPKLDHLFADTYAVNRLYASAAITQHFMSIINPTSDWSKRMISLMTRDFPGGPGLSIRHAGFPEGWEKLDLWK